MRTRLLLGFVTLLAVFGLMPSSAQAITNGQYDGTNHPYVAYLDNFVFSCSGALISPTVMLTAAHCFSDSTSAFGTNTVTGAPLVRVSVQPDNLPGPQEVYHVGSYYFDPSSLAGRTAVCQASTRMMLRSSSSRSKAARSRRARLASPP